MWPIYSRLHIPSKTTALTQTTEAIVSALAEPSGYFIQASTLEQLADATGWFPRDHLGAYHLGYLVLLKAVTYPVLLT